MPEGQRGNTTFREEKGILTTSESAKITRLLPAWASLYGTNAPDAEGWLILCFTRHKKRWRHRENSSCHKRGLFGSLAVKGMFWNNVFYANNRARARQVN
jgi:hypothetical protein